MFCRNCGKELTGAPEICLNCGAKPTAGTSFCPGCGTPTTPLTEICTKCGVRLAEAIRGKTWRTRTAGILAIVAGAVAVTQWVTIAVVEIRYWGGLPIGGRIDGIVAAAFAIVIASAIVAIVGGVFALKRKRWRLALAGSICAIFSLIFVPVLLNVPLAIAAIVLVVLGKGEFDQSPRLGKSCESDLKEL
jgi:uncharacterized OB-fold protein